jgi:hypothetical protein
MPEALARQTMAGCPMCAPTGEATPVSLRLSCTNVNTVCATGAATAEEGEGGGEAAATEKVSYDPAWAKLGQNWEMREADYRLRDELDGWLPRRIFDAHLHLWNFAYWGERYAPNYAFLGHDGSVTAYKQRMGLLFGQGREVCGLVLPFPLRGLSSEAAMSSWAAEQCRGDKAVYSPSLLITPATSYDSILDGVRKYGYTNLKPYHVYSTGSNTVPSTGQPSANTSYAEIEDFLTDEHCRAANDCELAITLHMVKPRALAEETNQHKIREYCTRYPKMKLILGRCMLHAPSMPRTQKNLSCLQHMQPADSICTTQSRPFTHLRALTTYISTLELFARRGRSVLAYGNLERRKYCSESKCPSAVSFATACSQSNS